MCKLILFSLSFVLAGSYVHMYRYPVRISLSEEPFETQTGTFNLSLRDDDYHELQKIQIENLRMENGSVFYDHFEFRNRTSEIGYIEFSWKRTGAPLERGSYPTILFNNITVGPSDTEPIAYYKWGDVTTMLPGDKYVLQKRKKLTKVASATT